MSKMINGKFTCGFNMPIAWSGDAEHGLPPYAEVNPYLVDEYPRCPENWMRSTGRTKSYFVSVQEDRGMWLDFNQNSKLDRHVAIVISVQGINPITGMPCLNAKMEQYIDTCPKHNIDFGPDRFCKECGFKWPKQNYICTTGTPSGELWLDGFKTAEGIVRQYILTSEKIRGVASNIIGEDRVYAIGISFFTAKDKKPITNANTIYRSMTYTSDFGAKSGSPQFFSPVNAPVDWQVTTENENSTTYCYFNSSSQCCSSTSNSGTASKGSIIGSSINNYSECMVNEVLPNDGIFDKISKKRCNNEARSINIRKKLEVGAGAKIKQSIYDDPENLDFWHDEAESLICINYCEESEANEILSCHMAINSCENGFLENIPVGN